MKSTPLILILLFFASYSCKDSSDKRLKYYLSDRPEFQTLKITIDSSLQLIVDKRFHNNSNYKNNYQIINIINTDCGTCYEVMDKWNEYLKNNDIKASVFFIAIGEQNEYFKSYLLDKDDILFSVYLDKFDDFCEKNGIIEYKKETFVINKEGLIILYGDPTKSEIVNEYYKQILQK